MTAFRNFLKAQYSRLDESLHLELDKAAKILGLPQGKLSPLLAKIQKADPYEDRRLCSMIADWLKSKQIQTPEEHAEELREYKTNYAKLKKLSVTGNMRANVDRLLGFKLGHGKKLKELIEWLNYVRELFGAAKIELNDSEKHLIFAQKVIDDKTFLVLKFEHKEDVCLKIARSLPYCVTKSSFGNYGGPPYYAIVTIQNMKISPFAMIIPNYLNHDTHEAVRNATNTGRLSLEKVQLIKPLLTQIIKAEDQNPLSDALYKSSNPNDYIKKLKLPGQQDFLHRLKKGDPILAQITAEPEAAFLYATEVLKGPFPEGEDAIAKNTHFAFLYATKVLKGPFPKGEAAISLNIRQAIQYTSVKGRWPEIEPAILKNPPLIISYASAIKERWLEAEPFIANGDFEIALNYTNSILKGKRFLDLEKHILKSKDIEKAYRYVKEIIKGPWPEAETLIQSSAKYNSLYKRILKKQELKPKSAPTNNGINSTLPEEVNTPLDAARYAVNVIKGRWPEGEPYILQNAKAAVQYANGILKKRWPEAEAIIGSNVNTALTYARSVLKGRFIAAEPLIATSPFINGQYKHFLQKKGLADAYLKATGQQPMPENYSTSLPTWTEFYQSRREK